MAKKIQNYKQVYFTAYSEDEVYLCKGEIHHTNKKGIARVIVHEVGGQPNQDMTLGKKLLSSKIPKNKEDIIENPNIMFLGIYTQWLKIN